MASINGTSGSDTLSGTSGADDIYGFDGPDSLIGDAGNDHLYGGPGDDSLSGNADDDILDGGAGNDVAYFSTSFMASITINLLTGTAYGPYSGLDTLIDIENVYVSGSGSVTLTGDNGNNSLFAAVSYGAHNIQGGGGDDFINSVFDFGSTFDGGSGSNALSVSREFQNNGYGNTLTVSTAPFVLTFTPGVSGTMPDGTSYANFDFLSISTGAGNDSITFNQPKIPTKASGIQNSWRAGDGNDTATVDLSNYSTALWMDASVYGGTFARIQVASTSADIVFLTDVENFRIYGGSGNDDFTGYNGNDILGGGGGNDVLKGGGGTDMARYSGLPQDYQVTLLAPRSVQVKDMRPDSPDGTDTLSDIERLQWSDSTFSTIFNSSPILTTTDKVVQPNQTLSLSSLFSITDADFDMMTRYQLWDSTRDPNSGHFVVGNAAQAAGTIIDITAAQLAQTSFVAGTVGDSLQIRAYDGNDWSAADTAAWAPFTVSMPVNHAPVVTSFSVAVRANTTLSLSNLAQVSDADGDAITRYQLWDSTRDPTSGHFVVNGIDQPAGTVIDITAAQAGQTYFITGSVIEDLQIRAFDGQAWSAADAAPWSPLRIVQPETFPPLVITVNQSAHPGQTLSLSNLFTVHAYNGDPIAKYQLWDSTRDPNSGHFVINGIDQPAGSIIEITAVQLSQASFTVGNVGDTLQIRAFDGTYWSASDTAAWAPFSITIQNTAPSVTAPNTTLARSQTVALSSLVSVNDAENDAIIKYQLWDSSRDPNSGHFMMNGQILAAGTVIDLTPAEFAQTSFITGRTGDSLQIRAFDGISWSAADNAPWSPFTITVPANSPPTLSPTPPPGVIGGFPNTSITLSDMLSLINMADADGDAITRVQLWDSTANPFSGHWSINGIAQSASSVIDIDASQIAQVSFDTGRVSDNLQIRVFDGIDWSAADNAAWSPFTFVVTNTAPAVGTSSPTPEHGRTLLPSDLFFVGDGDGDPITRYQLWDSTRDPDSGHFVVNGQVQAAGTIIDLTPAQLAQTVFVTGKVSDSLQVRAFDGLEWSAADNAPWSPFAVTVTPYTSPSLTTSDVNTTPGQTLALSSLFSVSDPDGDSMTRYQLWDSTADSNSGHWVVNGVAKSASTVIDITAAQFSQTSFLTGTVGDSLQIRAFDGISWSAADNAAWAPFHINV